MDRSITDCANGDTNARVFARVARGWSGVVGFERVDGVTIFVCVCFFFVYLVCVVSLAIANCETAQTLGVVKSQTNCTNRVSDKLKTLRARQIVSAMLTCVN